MKPGWSSAVSSLLFVLLSPVCCLQAVNCRWGSYGGWSECDGCTNTQVRTRGVDVFAQFGGAPCPGDATQTQPCVTQTGCPLQTGCGGRFRCTSGQCISHALVCNGDQDCEDGLDERGCDEDGSHYSCQLDKAPPNSDVTGRGFDVLTGKLRAGVINTQSFGGQCRTVFSGDHKTLFRLPQNILRYNFEVTVDNEDSDESYESSWHYTQHIQANALIGYDRRTFHKELTETKAHKLIILKSKVELAQFQNSAPQYLTLAEGFWRALSSLPSTYHYAAYRHLLLTYGTHYLSEGSLGGHFHALLELDRQALATSSMTNIDYQRCWRKVKRRLFRKKVKTVCEKLTRAFSSRDANNANQIQVKANIVGGDPSFADVLTTLDVEHPEANGAAYDNWASSVKDFPEVIDHKLRPLYELVKEVQCAGLKRLHLRRAMEEYEAEADPCRCRPCQNNGQPLLEGTQCLCVCRPGTSGTACQIGTPIGEQPGVIHGRWSCWSAWGACSGGQRSRTRSCNNPAPSSGGQHCPGAQLEYKACQDADTQHLQMMEPQCFGLSVSPPKTCRPPPGLRNGFVQDPRDVYLVRNMVQYSCVSGFYLSGGSEAECTENQTWRSGTMVCKSATCGFLQLSGDVTATPMKVAYQIGERVSLSCPAGSRLDGDVSDIICSPSLQWSPSPSAARCHQAATDPPPPSGLKCKLWEKLGKSECVCKMPFECSASLLLCARVGSGRPRLLGLCQLGALQCVGRSFTLASDSECSWPADTPTSCEDCPPGTACHATRGTTFCNRETGLELGSRDAVEEKSLLMKLTDAGECVCQSASQCPRDSAPLCISTGGASVTVSECQAGARRCAGEQLSVIATDTCPQ